MTDVKRGSEGVGSRGRAAAEAIGATVFYILFAFAGLRLIDISAALNWLEAGEAQVVSGFIVGALFQLGALLLLWFAFRPVDLREAVAAISRTPSAEGWFIGLTIIAVETVVMYAFFLDVGWTAAEPSALNLTGSLAPALDGVTQEVFFRGYLILRLRRGGFGVFGQLLLSSLAFSAIHVGYLGDGWGGAVPPLLGTLGLGAALGWAFVRAGDSLLPPIVAHVAILVVIQPWLALAS